MVLLKQLFKEACEKYSYNDFFENELYFAEGEEKERLRRTILRRKIDELGGVDFFREEKRKGKNVDEVADELGCGVSTIYDYLRKEGLTWRQLSPYVIIGAGFNTNGKKVYWLKRTSDNKYIRASIDRDVLTSLMEELMMEE